MADLSPAAQALLDATRVKFYESPPTGAELASWILHALADHQQAPIALGSPIDHWHPDERTRQELRNLAAELTASNH